MDSQAENPVRFGQKRFAIEDIGQRPGDSPIFDRRSLPSGTVTFLFTDIEGSTRLLRQLGDAYAELLAGQRAILRRVLAKWDGREVDTQGDAFFYAFPAARKAVAAAAEAQREIAGATWPGGVELKVRMGLHTGEPIDQSDEGYVGMDVHRAARLAHAGHGGQVLLSPSTVGLVERDLPQGLGLEDLGKHWLKDLENPLRITQLSVDGLEREYPALKTAAARRHNLPSPISSFIGREQELAEIAGLLADPQVRLLTLTGPPGVGKTRLALEAAWRETANYEGGVWWLDLVPVDGTAGVLSAMADAFGLQLDSQDESESVSQLVLHLTEGSRVLVLDNCEHLLESVADLAERLLSQVPGLTVLATSREALGLKGERKVPVLGLEVLETGEHVQGLSPAAQLLLERARDAGRPIDSPQRDSELLNEVCDQLDGLPLAIELAAAKLPAMSLAELAQNLSQRFSLLRSSRAGRDKLQSILKSIEWSYELLSHDEKRMFLQLALCRAGCEAEQALEMCEQSGSGVVWLEILLGLVDKNLVVARQEGEAPTRYFLLESLREFALIKLEERSETARSRMAFCRAYQSLARQAAGHMFTPEDWIWLRRLRREHRNLNSCLTILRQAGKPQDLAEMLLDLEEYLVFRHDEHSWIKPIILELLEGGLGQRTTLKLRLFAGFIQIVEFNDLVESEEFKLESVRLAEELEDGYLMGTAYSQLVNVRHWQGRHDEATALAQRIYKLGQELNHAKLALSGLEDQIASSPNTHDEVLWEEFEQAARSLGAANELGRVWNSAGYLKLRIGELDKAIEYFSMSKEEAEKAQVISIIAQDERLIAHCYQAKGEYDRAVQIIVESRSIWERLSLAMQALYWVSVEDIYISMGDFGSAVEAGEKGEEVWPDEEAFESIRADRLFLRGIRSYYTEDYEKCHQLMERAAALLESVGQRQEAGSCQIMTADCLHRRREITRAARLLADTLSDPVQFDRSLGGICWVLRSLAYLLIGLEQYQAASLLLAADLASRERAGIVIAVPERSRYQGALGEVKRMVGDLRWQSEMESRQKDDPYQAARNGVGFLAEFLESLESAA